MAAPTVDKSREGANLNKLLAREKSAKPTQKNILCAGTIEWPRPTKEIEDVILKRLSEILKSLPDIFSAEKTREENSDKKEKKAKARSQLRVGASEVLRALEQDCLECVLVSGSATPALAVDPIVSLGRERRCPLLCLDGLSVAVAGASRSKCMPLTVGFKKQGSESSDFSEVVGLVKANAPVLPCKDLTPASKGTVGGDADTGLLSQKSISTSEAGGGHKVRTFQIDPAAAKDILAELKRIFLSALAENPISSKDEKKQKKRKKKKKQVKDPFAKFLVPQFEAGKRCIARAAERRLLELVLASQEVEAILAKTDLLSFERLRSDKRPPIIIIPGLTGMLREVTVDACHLTFLGIKKLSKLSEQSSQDFERVIELSLESLKRTSCLDASKSNQTHDENNSAGKEKAFDVKTGLKEKVAEEEEKDKIVRKSGTDKDEDDEDEEVDYSYLYVLKKDSKDLLTQRSELKSELEELKKVSTFSSDFISLSSSSTQISRDKPASNDPPKAKKAKKRLPKIVSALPPVLDSSGVVLGSASKGKALLPESKSTVKEVFQAGGEPSNFGFLAFSNSISEQDSKLTDIKEPALDSQRQHAEVSVLDTKVMFSVDKRKDTEDDTKNASSLSSGDSSTLFSLDRNKTTVAWSLLSPPQREKGQVSEKVLGDGGSKKSGGSRGMDYLALDISNKSKKRTKATKRKLGKEEGFLSFAYSEANIKTMVSDPSKKRKKKKKNK